MKIIKEEISLFFGTPSEYNEYKNMFKETIWKEKGFILTANGIYSTFIKIYS
jgi:hypothetical protein